MNKRQFIANSMRVVLGAAGASALSGQAASDRPADTQVILTVTGAISQTNRGKFDVMLDQLMHKHAIHFDRAFQFALADLEKLPAVTINPTMEYDTRAHALRGPRLLDVLNAAGINKTKATKIIFHGVDGYSPEVTFDQAQKYNFILATHIDGEPQHIGGFGPLFAIYDADHIPEFAQKPLNQRFAACAWGLYCIEVA
jgi:hypothetical protein